MMFASHMAVSTNRGSFKRGLGRLEISLSFSLELILTRTVFGCFHKLRAPFVGVLVIWPLLVGVYITAF